MKQKLYNKTIVIGVVLLFLGAGFVSVTGIKLNNDEIIASGVRNTVTITAGTPTTDGKWTVNIKHDGTWNGYPYVGTWTFTIPTHAGMTAAEKAEAMRQAINGREGCPLTAGGAGPNVDVSSDNGNIVKYSSKSTDGQMVHGTQTSLSGYSFTGTPSTGAVSVDIGGFIATTTTAGKSLMQIHSDLFIILQLQGFPVFMDPSGLAFSVLGVYPAVGLDSDDDGLDSLGDFLLDISDEPFGVCVGMQDNIVVNPGDITNVVFDVCNFRCLPDVYKIVVTDNLGWDIDPIYMELSFAPGESKLIDIGVTTPTGKFATANIINVTVSSFASPWITGSGLIQVLVNNAPDAPAITGSTTGAPGTEYEYTFVASDPDGDDVSYYIEWGDGTNTGWTTTSPSGVEITESHTWSAKGTFVIKAKAKDVSGLEGLEGTLSVKMPKAFSVNAVLMRLFYRFPILKQLLSR